MNKMVMVIYNEALDDEVMEVLTKCASKNYTKIPGVFGQGASSGTHLGNDIWPGRNNILYIVCAEEKAKIALSYIRELRKRLGKEGVKAFLLPVEEVT